MEPNRKEHRLSRVCRASAAEIATNPPGRAGPIAHGRRLVRAPRRQAGITLIGFLLLAALFGVVGFGVIKLVPMYMRNLTLTTVLKDVSNELSGQAATPGAIRVALNRRFDVEGIELPVENVKISQVRDGYQVRIQYEARSHYFSDIWLLVTFDKQVDIRR
jgi:hypothetical protein